jgi:hypothetical protein
MAWLGQKVFQEARRHNAVVPGDDQRDAYIDTRAIRFHEYTLYRARQKSRRLC